MISPDISLEDIRRDIDAIDDGLLDLMIRRLTATARVRSSKSIGGSLHASPFRPAREAQMLRRLLAAGKGLIEPHLVVRLWRVILSSSIQEQAPVRLHVELGLAEDIETRAGLAEHFCGFKIESHASLAAALAALSGSPGDLAIVKTDSAWADVLTVGSGVIGTLPVLKAGGMPRLLIVGHGEPVPSGDDETLLLSSTPLPSTGAPPPRWRSRSGAWHVTCLAGFEARPQHTESSLSYRVAGRFPAPIEVSP